MAVEERLQPSGGTAADERFIKSAEAVYRGGYDELRDMADGFRQFDPMDDTPGFVVNTWRLEREPGGLATLRVYGVPESASTWAGETRSTNPFYDAWSVKTVRVDVSAMAYCGTAKNNPQRALVEKWLAETDRGAASRRTFMENGAEYDMEEKAPPTYELIGKMQAGKESVMRFHPVVTRRRHYRKPPQDAMDKVGFIDNPPKPDGEAAEAATASNVTRVAQAYSEGFGRGTNELAAAMANLPTNGILVGLRFPLVPQTSRKFDIYVASNHYDSASNRDELYVYFGQSYTNPPTMGVPYVWDSGATTQRVAGAWTLPGTSHRWTDVYSVTERQKSGTVAYPCHRLFVARPSALRGLPLNLNPHGVWGGPEGMAFGSYLLTAGASRAAAWTGAVTNAPEGVIAVFDNGFFVGLKEIER